MLLAAALLPGTVADQAERALRAGESAFDRADFQAALAHYTSAEFGTSDPGLAAFNRATALYRLGRFSEAAGYYTRALEDATGTRTARTLYNLGNSLVQEARDQDAALLERAVKTYERCLREPALDASLGQDARANLKLAKALLVRAKAARGSSQDQSSDSRQQNPDPRSRSAHGVTQDSGSDDSSPGAPRDKRPGTPGIDAQPRASSETPPPGAGNLPSIPDRDDLTPLSPEATAAYLEQVAARVLRERRGSRRPAPAHSANILDW